MRTRPKRLLPVAADLVDRFGLPTVNDPRKIERTTRDAVARLLQGIPGCRVPQSPASEGWGRSFGGGARGASCRFLPRVWRGRSGPMAAMILKRSKIVAALAAFLSQRPDHDHYLIEYIDYRSADGYFRKYRFIFVDGQILPYHLCIGSDWKLHHINTDMAHQPWMQQEEEAFLNDPAAVFGPAQYQALQAIRERIGLEYFGIDCGAGRVRKSRRVRGQRLDAGSRPQRGISSTRRRPSTGSSWHSMRCCESSRPPPERGRFRPRRRASTLLQLLGLQHRRQRAFAEPP